MEPLASLSQVLPIKSAWGNVQEASGGQLLAHLETGISVQVGWVPKGPGCFCHCSHANSRAQSLQEACLRLACWVQLAFCLLKVLEHLLKQLD